MSHLDVLMLKCVHISLIERFKDHGYFIVLQPQLHHEDDDDGTVFTIPEMKSIIDNNLNASSQLELRESCERAERAA